MNEIMMVWKEIFNLYPYMLIFSFLFVRYCYIRKVGNKEVNQDE
jgi:hypothetical protein